MKYIENLNHEKIVFIGAGNVATHFSQAIKHGGYQMWQVYSRSLDSARSLANVLKCKYTTDLKAVKTDADIYFFSISDDALPAIIAKMPPNNGLWVHTAGSIPMDVFRNYTKRYGVMYPLQTLSKQRETDLSDVPLLIEANSINDNELLFDVGNYISDNIIDMSSDKRKYVHLAAVFTSNFSNHLYALAAHFLEKQGIDWHILHSLLYETVAKTYDIPPLKAQTGPAVRGDHAIMAQHLSMLEDETMRKIYTLISESIQTHPNIKDNDRL